MLASGRRVIFNVASIDATRGRSERFAYSMAKGTVLSMTLSAAKDYVGQDIRCSCISSAHMHTPFVYDSLKKTATVINLSR